MFIYAIILLKILKNNELPFIAFQYFFAFETETPVVDGLSESIKLGNFSNKFLTIFYGDHYSIVKYKSKKNH